MVLILAFTTLFLQLCQELFGDMFTLPYVEEMAQGSNDYYGATTLDVQNVVFVHGSIDPWHSMGRLTDLNENSPAIIIPGIYVNVDKQSPHLYF